MRSWLGLLSKINFTPTVGSNGGDSSRFEKGEISLSCILIRPETDHRGVSLNRAGCQAKGAGSPVGTTSFKGLATNGIENRGPDRHEPEEFQPARRGGRLSS